MIKYPELTDIERLQKTQIPTSRRIKVILDTDAYNEIDDQFAIIYAMLSSDRLDMKAINAALFYNERSNSPGDGMEKSYNEICKIMGYLGKRTDGFVFRGCTSPLKNTETPEHSEAVDNLIRCAKACSDDEPLFVVGIGACTNIASAIIQNPDIIKKIVVVWLGGNTYDWVYDNEFNLSQDINAGKVLFDCGVSLIQVPAFGVTNFLLTSVPELESCIGGVNPLCDYLLENVKSYRENHFAWSKPIWDIGAIALLVNPDFVCHKIVNSPVVVSSSSYSFDCRRHLIRCVYRIDRDPVFYDMFAKLRKFGNP